MSNAQAYNIAKKEYAKLGLDTDRAIRAALRMPISMHCWQADDVGGFETREEGVAGGGIMATGNYPGRARTGDEARQDYDKVLDLVPGKLRLNIHAFYAETGSKVVDRDALKPEHFANWMAWGSRRRVALDFNPTFFAHPKANAGFTLSSDDPAIRRFWIRHCIASRKIAEAMAAAPASSTTGSPTGRRIFPPTAGRTGNCSRNRSTPRSYAKRR